ncbi:hypothetical protein WN48_06072 [Eufriesea mexicana]|nr:hypothetical protein WN48_06072 [Eufriesea mexicana]
MEERRKIREMECIRVRKKGEREEVFRAADCEKQVRKERPAVSSCDVTQVPHGRLGNEGGQVDNAPNPLLVSGSCFSLYLFTIFSILAILKGNAVIDLTLTRLIRLLIKAR